MSGILEAHLADREFVGAVLARRQADGTSVTATSGTQSLDGDSGAVDPDIPWGIGSVTKAFVAVVVLQLAEEGALDLDAGIDTFLPELPAADRITPRQLLQHTSGLGEYLHEPAVQSDARREWTPGRADRRRRGSRADRRARRAACLLQHQLHPARPDHRAGDGQLLGRRAAGAHRRAARPAQHSAHRRSRSARPRGGGRGVRRLHRSLASLRRRRRRRAASRPRRTCSCSSRRWPTAGCSPRTARPRWSHSFRPRTCRSSASPTGTASDFLEEYVTDQLTVNGHLGGGSAHSAFVGFDRQSGAAVAATTNTDSRRPAGIHGLRGARPRPAVELSASRGRVERDHPHRPASATASSNGGVMPLVGVEAPLGRLYR